MHKQEKIVLREPLRKPHYHDDHPSDHIGESIDTHQHINAIEHVSNKLILKHKPHYGFENRRASFDLGLNLKNHLPHLKHLHSKLH